MKNKQSLSSLIKKMAKNPDLWTMGHSQDHERRDLGLGWLYFGLARTLRPSQAVVIGSWRGFVPLLIAQAIQENANEGRVLFIDPSLADDHWKNGRASEYFSSFGIHCIEHKQITSQEAITAPWFKQLEVDFLFIDGLHTEEQCRLEFEAFLPQLGPDGIVLFHDSNSQIVSKIYGEQKPYIHSVWKYIEKLRKDPRLQVFDLFIDQGVSMVQRRPTPPKDLEQ